MVPTYTTDVNPRDRYYVNLYERAQRDPVSPEQPTRATVPMGRGFDMWRRFNGDTELVYVDDMEGRPRGLTPKQYEVLTLALEMVDGQMLTMREMAARLRVAPSTVSRALARLSAWGILCYIVGRGRYAGLVIIRRAKGDGWDHLRDAARARVKRWREAAERRFSRLIANVALSHPQKEWDSHGYGYLHDTYMSATLAQPWTVDDLEGIG